MALPSSGSISLSQVNVELGVSATATRSLNDATTRTLFGVASGAISMSQGYGKANQFSFTISSNQTNANLRTLAVNAGWNQSSRVAATINSGIYISSNGTGTPALTVNGSFPGGVELTNNGFIVGMGGAGGAGANGSVPGLTGVGGGGGGISLSASVGVAIRNNGTIGGGGGGGGGGGQVFVAGDKNNSDAGWGGGGGGGGQTGATNSSGGAPGDYSLSLSRISTAGGSGTSSSGGGGGQSAAAPNSQFRGGAGGGGGSWGAGGASGQSGGSPTVGTTVGGVGGGGGSAISGNGNITWLATGTRLGGIG